MSISDLFQWWNLIFDLPFVAALIPLLLQATGAAHLGHGGHGIHVHHEIGHGGFHGHQLPHVGHHVEASHAGTPGQGSHGAMTHQAHAHTESPGPLSRVFGLLGIGKVPIMMVFSSFSFVWGFTGIVSNLFFRNIFNAPSIYVWPSMVAALLSSFVLTSLLSNAFNRLMPSIETYGTPQDELVGRTGRAAYQITGTSGAATVLDNELNRVQVKCRTEDGSSIQSGAKIALMRYDEPSQTFYVCPATEALMTSTHPTNE